MTDTDKLKRLAEAVKTDDGGRWDDWQEFRRLTSPDSILALIRNLDTEKGRLEAKLKIATEALEEVKYYRLPSVSAASVFTGGADCRRIAEQALARIKEVEN